jgi:hypothetical protein
MNQEVVEGAMPSPGVCVVEGEGESELKRKIAATGLFKDVRHGHFFDMWQISCGRRASQYNLNVVSRRKRRLGQNLPDLTPPPISARRRGNLMAKADLLEPSARESQP